jgi:hypothetical protein
MSWAHLIEFGVAAFIILLIVLIGSWIGKRRGALEDEVDTKPGSGILGVSKTIFTETLKRPRSVTRIRKR